MNNDNSLLLSRDALFTSIPQQVLESSALSIEDLLRGLKTKMDYSKLADMTYWLLKKRDISLRDQLKLWEIRLTLHLFNDRLSLAKKEAISLNNVLYLQENSNASSGIRRQRGSNEGYSSPASSSSLLGLGPAVGQPIYPLPKNNNGNIDHSLLICLLRLKSIPNLNLVTELYKLCYQLRLRYSPLIEAQEQLALKLTNLSYDIITILLITKNLLTLINFLGSIRFEIKTNYNDEALENSVSTLRYLSNVTVLSIIVEAMIAGKTMPHEALMLIIEEKYQTDYDNHVLNFSIQSIAYVLTKISPNISQDSVPLDSLPELNLASIVRLVVSGAISVRILCCTLGLWDLTNIFHFGISLEEDKIFLLPPKDDTPIMPPVDECRMVLMDNWRLHINKVYGLE